MTATRTPATPAAPARRGRAAAAAAAITALAAAAALTAGTAGTPARAAALTGCAASPASCGYPAAATTGVPAGTTLVSVPAQVSSGPGWKYVAATGEVTVTGNGAVLSGLNIPCTVEIDASNVTVKNSQVVTGGTIANSVIKGTNATSGRVNVAIDDVYGDSTGMTITGNNISAFRTAMQVSAGLVQGNYIHDPGYIAGDHTNGIVTGGGTTAMTIKDNTVFNTLGQTDAITLDASAGGVPVANKTVQGNFLAGGGYSVYAGDGPSGNPTSHIVITGNRIGQQYYAKGGQFGAGAYYDPAGTGNTWTANTWDTTGQAIPAP